MVFSFSAAVAQASSSAATIRWSAPAGCPVEAEIRRGVEELLRARSTDPEGHDGVVAEKSVGVVATVARSSDGTFEAHLTLSSGDGNDERHFSGETCRSVANAVMLISALAIDATQVAQSVLPTAPSPQSSPAPADDLHATVAARAAGDVGSLPDWTAGLGLSVSVEGMRGWLEAELTTWLPRTALHRTRPDDQGGEIGLVSAGLRLCPVVLNGRSFAFGPSVSGELGAMYGRGMGLAHPRTAHGLWGAAAVGLALRTRSRRGAFVQFSLDGLVALRRPSFAINHGSVIFQSQRFGGRVSIGAGWRFP
ncbi:MAG: hypothetical protein QM778_27945 [Myxococcales bacterium]